MRRMLPVVLALVLLAAAVAPAAAREIHVATTGDDSAAGTAAAPYRTVNHAAQVARPGDVVTVHAGTYREWIKPARGGTGEDARITYRAAEGEEVLLKGSERITSWTDEGGGVWKVELPNDFFGDYNPYALTLSGGWLHYGQWHHRGDVYLDGEALREQQTPDAVRETPLSWHAAAGEKTTVIRAHFGRTDPNARLAEINVRRCVFFPARSGLSYVTVEGFHLMHSAENWQPPGLDVQRGAIGPRMGRRWIIQDCRITNARCVGIVLGHAQGVDRDDVDAFGDHVVRRNVIRRCGEAGIAGQKGATRCLIEGNLIEETNYRKEFGGWETAAVKFHQSVDTVIRGNLIRRTGRKSHAGFGIWMDWANQGTRITGNVIYETDTEAVFLEMNHGPILVDNNVLVGGGVKSNSEACVFAHNLFVDCPFRMVSDTNRRSQIYKPHTRQTVGRKTGVPRDDKWFNNIFVGRGLEGVKAAPGYASDWNVFLGGAKKSAFGDAHSAVSPVAVDFEMTDRPRGVRLTFRLNDLPTTGNRPWVDADLVGVMPTVGQTIEDREGRPIRVEPDLVGRRRDRPVAGPLADLKKGTNTVEWSMDRAGR
jgi:hypothetical protein